MNTVKEVMENKRPFGIVGCDPGPTHTALVRTFFVCEEGRYTVAEVECRYIENDKIDTSVGALTIGHAAYPLFLAIEICGAQFNRVGESVFETAAMGGVVRHAMRPFVQGIYCMRSSAWRHALTGAGNARAPAVYEEIKRFFLPAGGGSDPYKGLAAKPGPLWPLFEAGKGGNAEHLKDALGCALGLTMVGFRSGQSPEQYRRAW